MQARIPFLVAMALSLGPGVSLGQDSIPARVIRPLPGGSYVVRIRNDTLIAITQDAARKSLNLEVELRAAKQETGARILSSRHTNGRRSGTTARWCGSAR